MRFLHQRRGDFVIDAGQADIKAGAEEIFAVREMQIDLGVSRLGYRALPCISCFPQCVDLACVQDFWPRGSSPGSKYSRPSGPIAVT